MSLEVLVDDCRVVVVWSDVLVSAYSPRFLRLERSFHHVEAFSFAARSARCQFSIVANAVCVASRGKNWAIVSFERPRRDGVVSGRLAVGAG